MEFKSYLLEDVAMFRNAKISVEDIEDKDYISTENMLPNKNGVTFDGSKPTSGNVNRFSRKDILISNIRPYFKKIWFSDRVGAASPDVLILGGKEEILLPKFLYYVLSNDVFFDYMVKTSKGTKMPRGDKNAILKYEVKIPSIKYQAKITNILSLIDEKVLVNKNLIKSLGSICDSLFKRWFIDFEFPNEQGLPYRSSGGEMVESELGEIPKFFEIKELLSICEVKDGTHDSPKQAIEGFPLVTSKHLMDNSIDFSSAKLISTEDYEKVNRRSQVDTNDILISMIGTVGKLYLVHDKEINFAIKNIGLIKTSQIDDYEYIFSYFKSNFMQNYIKERTTGSTQQYISLTELRKVPVLVPSEQVLTAYKRVIKPLYEMIALITVENQRLVLLRDSLLPKLLSGEIEIPDESVVERL